eukprot:2012400-Rhodomonas_salina.2
MQVQGAWTVAATLAGELLAVCAPATLLPVVPEDIEADEHLGTPIAGEPSLPRSRALEEKERMGWSLVQGCGKRWREEEAEQ